MLKKLEIPFHSVNFSHEYWDSVFEHFLAEYRAGRTPNPDILCNREIKFKAFLNYAQQLGADCIATGHYVQTTLTEMGYEMKKAADLNKDQSYFLYTLGQPALTKSLFPIGHLDKTSVREMAKSAEFPNFQKKDSTGICFIGERKFKNFLNQFIPAQPGPIVTPEGKNLGQHDGLMFYTLGQRQGIGIGGQTAFENAPWYVVAKDLERNVLVVAQGEHSLLYTTSLKANDLHWILGHPPKEWFNCTAKIRYRQTETPCTVELTDKDQCSVRFKYPQRAITPGQSVVFYQDNICLGGGIIH